MAERTGHALHHRPPGSTAAAVLALMLLISTGVVWRAAYCAFVVTTGNPGNTWGAGAVTLGNGAAGTAIFDNVGGLTPGSTGTKCILVTYTGDVPSTVRLYTQNYSGALAAYVTMTVQTGSGTVCTLFGTATTIFSGTLADLGTTKIDFGTGLPAASPWNPVVNGATRPYRFTYTLGDDNAARGATAVIDLVWEARST